MANEPGQATTLYTNPKGILPFRNWIPSRSDLVNAQAMPLGIEPEDDDWRRKLSTNLRVATIAITLTLGNLAICIHRSSRVYMYQQSQCLLYYLGHDPSKVNEAWEVEESMCKIKEVQSPLSMIEGLDTFLQLLPGEAHLC